MEEIRSSHPSETTQEAQPLVRAALRLDGALIRRMYGGFLTCGAILAAVGGLLLVVWIALSVTGSDAFAFFTGDAQLWVFAVFLVCGLVMAIAVARMRREADKHVRTNLYQFFAEEFVVTTLMEDREIGSSRLRYADCKKIREKKQFFYLTFLSAGVFAVDKKQLTQEECACLRSLFGLPAKKS